MPAIVLAAINAKWIHPALALRLIKANMGEYEGETEILEFALRQPVSEQAAAILRARPAILGVSVSIWNHTATLTLLRELRRLWAEGAAPTPTVILGGPEASGLGESAELFRYADRIVRGEGELFFKTLCAGILTGKPEQGGKTVSPEPPELEDIDPGYRLYTDEDLRKKLVYVESARGCPFGCAFCLSSRTGVREFPVDRFLAEMDALFRRGAHRFKFLDRSFNLNIPRGVRILTFFLERLTPPQYVHFEMVPTRFPPELREVLRRFPAGTLRLEVGIQTFNPLTAGIIGRPSRPEEELAALAFLRAETTAIVHADIIAGLPGEDAASFGAGFDRLWQAGPQEIQVGILKGLPGTPLIRLAPAWGMRFSPEPPYETLETAALPKVDLDRLKNFARFWELIVNRGAFGDFEDRLFPRGEAVFARFLRLADYLRARFGRNWGIPRQDVRDALESYRE